MKKKGTLEIKAVTSLAYLDISVPVDDLEDIAKQMIGKPLTDGKGEGIKHVIGRITDAHWENGKIVYEEDLSPKGMALVRKKVRNKLFGRGVP